MMEKLKAQASHLAERVRKQRGLFWGMAVAVLLLLGLVAFCSTSGRHARGQGLPVAEAFDSLVSVLPKGSVVVGRFPDAERADLYYLNTGVLYCFNGKSKMLEEMSIAGVASGSLVDAKLSQDEKYLMLTVQQGKFYRLYRLNTLNRNIVDMEKVTAVDEDVVQVEERAPRKEEPAPAVPVIDEPLPEAAFADEPVGAGHEVKKEQPVESKSENAPEVTVIDN